MTEETLHPVPAGRDVLIEQIRVVTLALRPVALVIAVVIGFMTSMIVLDMARGRAETWFDSGDWSPILFIAVAFPLAVWHREQRFGPAFLWTLPVDRRRMAMARVFAGWLWLASATALFILWHRGLAIVAGVARPETTPLIALSGATSAYLLGSAVILGFRYPLRWILGGGGVVLLLGMLREATRARSGVATIDFDGFVAPLFYRAEPLWSRMPLYEQWAIGTVVSIAAGLAALWAALARHRERR